MSGGESFNLVADSWMPVRRLSGARQTIRPAEIVDGAASDHPIVAFDWGRPDLDAASRELLIGMLALTYAGRTEEELLADWKSPPDAAALDRRLAPFRDAFNLDGNGPRFMQDFDELAGKPVPIERLLIDGPGQFDLFVKRGFVDVLARPAAAIALYTLQAFAPQGGRGHRTSLRGGGPLTTLARAGAEQSSLWQTLLLNVPLSEDELDSLNCSPGLFPWLGPTRTSEKDPKGATSTHPSDVHHLQIFFGMPRRIRLNFNRNSARQNCDLTAALDAVIVRNYRTLNHGINYGAFLHALTPYRREKTSDTDWIPIHPQPGGISYRHWPDLALASNNSLRRRATCIGLAQRRLLRLKGGEPRLLACGFDMDNMKARAFVEADMPLIVLGDEGLSAEFEPRVRQMVDAATRAANALSARVRDALYDEGRGDAKASRFAALKERFYAETEEPFFTAAERLADDLRNADPEAFDVADPAKKAWARTAINAALRLFDEAVPLARVEDRRLERAIRARTNLVRFLRGKKFWETLGLNPPERPAFPE